MVNAATGPIKQAQTTYDKSAQQQQGNVTGLSQALASILGGIAPGVEQTYSDASARQAAFAKGFSDHMQAQLGQNASNTSSFLQNVVGAPTSQVQQVQGQVAPPAAGDTLYGIRGFIPASTLNEEGAAYAANARQLPAAAESQGLQQISRIQAAQQKQDAQFAQDIGTEAGKAPQYARQLKNDAFNQAYKTHEAKLADAKYKTQIDEFNANLKMSQARLAQTAARDARLAYQSDRAYQVQLANLGIRQKNQQLAALKAEALLKNGGFTPIQINKFKETAQIMADNTFNGVQAVDKKTLQPVFRNGKPVWLHAPLDYKGAVHEARREGIPLSIALPALFAKYTPGERGRPLTDTAKDGFNPVFAGAPGNAGTVLTADAVTKVTSQFLGVPYRWGGTSAKTGLDCSSFLQQAMGKLGVRIPRTTFAQVKAGTPVDLNQLQPGDAIFTEPGKNGPNHVGLYLGGGMVQESPHTGDVNKVIDLQSFLSGGFVAARRYLGNG